MNNFEMTEALAKKLNISYTEAKDALEAAGRNPEAAEELLAKAGRVPFSSKVKSAANTCASGIKHAADEGNKRDFIIMKDGRKLCSLPLTAAVIIGILGCELIVPAAIISLICGCSFKVEKTADALTAQPAPTYLPAGFSMDNSVTKNRTSSPISLEK